MSGKNRKNQEAATQVEEIIESQVGRETKTRFDLEQEILACWNVTNDIELWSTNNSANWSVLSGYYEQKFQGLWDTFEILIKEGKL